MLDNFERDEGIRHFQRGVALERVNRISEAVEEYRQAIDRYPHLREAHAALGFYYQRQGLLAKAAEEFRIVATLDGSFLAYFNLGHVMVELERYEEALEAFEQCLRREPEDPATHYEIAFIHYSCQRFELACDYLYVPASYYPDDWEVLNLLGKCYLGMQDYAQALATFNQALDLTPNLFGEIELYDNILTVERHCEFDTLASMKDRMYAQDGVICLGSASDDGVKVDVVQDYHLTYPDIGTTVQRLLALQQAYEWCFTSVVAVDRLARPLAGALAQLLGLPFRQVSELQEDDTPLMVLAVAREAELLLLTIERVPCAVVTFCLGLNWIRHSHVLPDMSGILARGACSVPWEPELRRLYADRAADEQIDACVEQAREAILQAVQMTPADGNLAQQVAYYTQQHRRLSFYEAEE